MKGFWLGMTLVCVAFAIYAAMTHNLGLLLWNLAWGTYDFYFYMKAE